MTKKHSEDTIQKVLRAYTAYGATEAAKLLGVSAPAVWATVKKYGTPNRAYAPRRKIEDFVELEKVETADDNEEAYIKIAVAMIEQCVVDIEFMPEKMADYFFGSGRKDWLWWLHQFQVSNANIAKLDVVLKKKVDFYLNRLNGEGRKIRGTSQEIQEQIVQLFTSGSSLGDICATVGIRKVRVRSILQRSGFSADLPARTVIDSTTEKIIHKMLQSGAKHKEVALKLGFTENAIYNHSRGIKNDRGNNNDWGYRG